MFKMLREFWILEVDVAKGWAFGFFSPAQTKSEFSLLVDAESGGCVCSYFLMPGITFRFLSSYIFRRIQ